MLKSKALGVIAATAPVQSVPTVVVSTANGSATAVTTPEKPTSGLNPYLDSLALGSQWANANGAPGPVKISYSAVHGSDPYNLVGGTGDVWSNDFLGTLSSAMSAWEAVTNIQFEQASNPTKANIWYWSLKDQLMGQTVGYHDFPIGSSDYSPPNVNYAAFNNNWSGADTTALGGYMYATFIHELGHGLGLAHPHDGGGGVGGSVFPGVRGPYSYGTNALNQEIWTIMSYNSGWRTMPISSNYDYGCAAGPMAFDIATIQLKYGTNINYQTGTNVYQLPTSNSTGTGWACIWDAGGTDTISNAGSSTSCTINLNAAPLTGPDAGGYVSWNNRIAGGFTIAHDVIIENAIGGSGNDTLIGNNYANVLDGGAGVDTLTGGAGNDTYIVDLVSSTGLLQDRVVEVISGGTADTIVLRGASSNAAAVTLTSSIAIENLDASATGFSKLNFSGNTSNNVLTGNDADNIFDGGLGIDTLIGGAGADIYIVDSFTDTITELSGGGADTILSSVTYSLNLLTDVENLTLTGNANINATGNASGNVLTGNRGANVLIGGGGNDTLIGDAGNDVLTGGADIDHFVFNVLAYASPNKDTITDFVHGTDVFDLSKSVFKGLGLTTGVLSSAAFYAGAGVSAAHSLDDRILYNTTNGNLYYDADGSGKSPATQIAILTNTPSNLSHDDFMIIG